MKKGKVLFAFCAALIGLLGFNGVSAKSAKAAEVSDFDCEFTVGERDDFTTSIYGCEEFTIYTEDEAKAAGIPEGYTGSVLSVGTGATSGKFNRGITLDFSEKKIPTNLVETISFRVYTNDDGNNDGYPEIRIPKPMSSGGWTMRYNSSNQVDQWVDIVLDARDNTNFFSNNGNEGFRAVSKDGYLYKFELALRTSTTTEAVFYIDSVKVGFVNDTTAPVITYNGADVVSISQGQKLPFEVSAYDEVQGDIQVEYIWSDPTKLDESGNPMGGEHTLTFKATDYFGNTSEKTITVIVKEADLVAPTIQIPTDTIRVKIGTKPLISVTATDDKDAKVEVIYTWSNGALDAYGKLTEGTHTLTLSATDLSGNKTEETITFIVTAEGNTVGDVIDEEELCKPVEPEIPETSEEPEPPVSEEPDVPPTSEEPEPPVSEEPDVPPTSEEPEPPVSEEPDVPPTSEEPEPPVSEEPDEPTSEEPELPATSEEEPSKKKGGCGGVINGLSVGAIGLLAAVLLKKKENE